MKPNHDKFKLADEVLKDHYSGSAFGGFNQRVYGYPENDVFYHEAQRYDRELRAGWNLADDMIRQGRLFYVHNFHHLECVSERGYAFPYGGTWVCNSCNRSRLNREWWKIKVYPDGNAWCCVGSGFEDLQESDNYAFGDTREAAIEAYGKKMVARVPA